MSSFGKILILFGIISILAGILLLFADKIPYIGKMPGDIRIEKENFKFYFPLTTSIILSVVVSLILWIISIFLKK
ncbi:MAG TPA: DUF2905 domain-containing protein [Bacteroidota bacterium]|jgi:uncharacterized protein HemY|nr:DUF2905 domain-containing protein [Bacteroidota bacterium]